MTWSPTPTRKHIECTPFDTRGPKRLWDAPAGVVHRARGDVGRMVKHDYLCPVHGRFELEVPSNDVPDGVACPTPIESVVPADAEQILRGLYEPADIDAALLVDPDAIAKIWKGTGACGLVSPWSPGTVSVWKSSGEVTS